jgi:hypothetical protein
MSPDIERCVDGESWPPGTGCIRVPGIASATQATPEVAPGGDGNVCGLIRHAYGWTMRHGPCADVMNITFPRSENHAALADPIEFRAVEKKRRIICKVSHATLHWANPETAGKESIQDLWNRYIDFVEDVAARRIELGYFESDGSIVVRLEDLTQARRAARS